MLLDEFTRFAGDRSNPERQRNAAWRLRGEVEFWREDHLGRLVLDDGDAITPDERHDPDETPVTILDASRLVQPTRRQVADGRLPEPERIFMAMIPVLAAWAWRLAAPTLPLARRVPPAYLILEGAWLYTAGSHNYGTEFVERFIREGRSRNVCVGLTGEFYEDIEPFGPFLSTLFVGRHRPRVSGERAELTERSARAALEAAGVGASDELRGRLGAFSAGNFLLRDWQGRTGFVRVDSIFR